VFIARLNVVLCSLVLSVVRVLLSVQQCFLPIFGKIMGFGAKIRSRRQKGGASKG
jgi:hypothetical protein